MNKPQVDSRDSRNGFTLTLTLRSHKLESEKEVVCDRHTSKNAGFSMPNYHAQLAEASEDTITHVYIKPFNRLQQKDIHLVNLTINFGTAQLAHPANMWCRMRCIRSRDLNQNWLLALSVHMQLCTSSWLTWCQAPGGTRARHRPFRRQAIAISASTHSPVSHSVLSDYEGY